MGLFSKPKKGLNNLNKIWQEAAEQTRKLPTPKPTPIVNPSQQQNKFPNELPHSNLKQIWLEATNRNKQSQVLPYDNLSKIYDEAGKRRPYPDNNNFNRDYFDNISNLKNPKDSDIITVNGITGIWVNKEECLNWRGPIPLEQYKINHDPDPTIIRKHRTQDIEAIQNISVKFLKPPPPPVPGDIIIKEEGVQSLPPAPPIIIRQQAAALVSQPPMVIREKPPRQPQPVPTQTITISGDRMSEPPPRQVIVERVPAAVSSPQDVIVERWLSYPRQKRNIIYEKSHGSHETYKVPQNIIIDWETTGHAIDTTNFNKQVKFLGVETADPIAYSARHSNELIESHQLPHLVNEYKTPHEEVLASNMSSSEFILTGDVDALNLVDKNREELNKYLLTKF